MSIRAVTEEQQLENLQRQYRMEEENLKRITSKAEEFQTRKSQLLEDQRQLNEDHNSLEADAQTLTEELKSRKQELAALKQERETSQ